MTASRRIEDLAAPIRGKAMDAIARWERDPWMVANGITVLVTCTHRPVADQEQAYAQGRTRAELDMKGLHHVKPRKGRIVTWAKPGFSKHNKRDRSGNPASKAFDVVPLRHGKCIWGVRGDGIDDDPTDDHTDDLEAWMRVGVIGEKAGLKWAGRWSKRKREFPHFEV